MARGEGPGANVARMSADRTLLARLTDRIGRRVGRLGNRRDRRRPEQVFILGNQKSGTTAIAALLAECIGEPYTPDVLYPHKVQLKDLLDGATSVAALARNHPESFQATVVKDNDFTFLYPSLAETFPTAGFVFVVRDPRQNIRSVLNRLKLPGDLDSLPEEQYGQLRKRLPGWHTILTGASFGSPADHYIDVLADRWVRANEVYLAARDRMTLLRYEDFDAAKRPVIERLATGLGFPVVNNISEVQDRQYQPLGDRSVTPEAFFGRDNLRRVERRCAALMPAFGYEPTQP